MNHFTIDFFIVGAAKSGTSAMQDYLNQHPDIYLPALKEIHHFAPDLLRHDDPQLNQENYFSLFKNATEEQCIGEASVFYMLSEVAARNIKTHNPKAKIIIMLRHPVDMMYSLHSQLVFNGEETVSDFEAALKAESLRKEGENLPPNTRIQEKHLYKEVVKYHKQVSRFIEEFGQSRVLVLFYDDFKKDTLSSFQKVLEFLDVSKGFVPQIKVINANKTVRNAKLQTLLRGFSNSPPGRLVKLVLPSKKVRRRIRERLQRLNSKAAQRQPLSKELRATLCEEMLPEVEKLEKLLNKNLEHWKS